MQFKLEQPQSCVLRQGNMILGWCQKIPQQNVIQTLCIGINADPKVDNDTGILGGSPCDVKPNEYLELKIDLHFVRRVAGIACECTSDSEGTADGAELKLEIHSSKNNSHWVPVSTATEATTVFTLEPQPRDSNLILQSHEFPEVHARYFRILFKCQEHCRLSVAMVLKYRTDTSSQALTTIADIPAKMSEKWHSIDGNLTESLLYYAAKFENRSCRRLAQILGMFALASSPLT